MAIIKKQVRWRTKKRNGKSRKWKTGVVEVHVPDSQVKAAAPAAAAPAKAKA